MVTDSSHTLFSMLCRSGLTPRLRGDGYSRLTMLRARCRVRTYAPFERGWLHMIFFEHLAQWHVRTYAPFERGWLHDNSLVIPSRNFVRTYAPFERGWLHLRMLVSSNLIVSQDLRPV